MSASSRSAALRLEQSAGTTPPPARLGTVLRHLLPYLWAPHWPLRLRLLAALALLFAAKGLNSTLPVLYKKAVDALSLQQPALLVLPVALPPPEVLVGLRGVGLAAGFGGSGFFSAGLGMGTGAGGGGASTGVMSTISGGVSGVAISGSGGISKSCSSSCGGSGASSAAESAAAGG